MKRSYYGQRANFFAITIDLFALESLERRSEQGQRKSLLMKPLLRQTSSKYLTQLHLVHSFRTRRSSFLDRHGRRHKFGGDGREVFAMRVRHILFQLTRHTTAVTIGQGPGTVRRTAVSFFIRKYFWIRVAEWDKDHPVVRKEGDHGQSNGFLSPTLRCGRKEAPSWLSTQGTLHPKSARGVHECLYGVVRVRNR